MYSKISKKIISKVILGSGNNFDPNQNPTVSETKSQSIHIPIQKEHSEIHDPSQKLVSELESVLISAVGISLDPAKVKSEHPYIPHRIIYLLKQIYSSPTQTSSQKQPFLSLKWNHYSFLVRLLASVITEYTSRFRTKSSEITDTWINGFDISSAHKLDKPSHQQSTHLNHILVSLIQEIGVVNTSNKIQSVGHVNMMLVSVANVPMYGLHFLQLLKRNLGVTMPFVSQQSTDASVHDSIDASKEDWILPVHQSVIQAELHARAVVYGFPHADAWLKDLIDRQVLVYMGGNNNQLLGTKYIYPESTSTHLQPQDRVSSQCISFDGRKGVVELMPIMMISNFYTQLLLSATTYADPSHVLSIMSRLESEQQNPTIKKPMFTHNMLILILYYFCAIGDTKKVLSIYTDYLSKHTKNSLYRHDFVSKIFQVMAWGCLVMVYKRNKLTTMKSIMRFDMPVRETQRSLTPPPWLSKLPINLQETTHLISRILSDMQTYNVSVTPYVMNAFMTHYVVRGRYGSAIDTFEKYVMPLSVTQSSSNTKPDVMGVRDMYAQELRMRSMQNMESDSASQKPSKNDMMPIDSGIIKRMPLLMESLVRWHHKSYTPIINQSKQISDSSINNVIVPNQSDIATYTILIDALFKLRQLDMIDAIVFYLSRQHQSKHMVKPDVKFYGMLLNGLNHIAEYDAIMYIFDLVFNDTPSNVGTSSSSVDMYCTKKLVPSIPIYHILITTCGYTRSIDKLYAIYMNLVTRYAIPATISAPITKKETDTGVKIPDSWRVVMAYALGRCGLVHQAEQILGIDTTIFGIPQHMSKSSHAPELPYMSNVPMSVMSDTQSTAQSRMVFQTGLLNTLITVYCLSQQYDNANRVFEAMIHDSHRSKQSDTNNDGFRFGKPDIHTFNTMIQVYAKQGKLFSVSQQNPMTDTDDTSNVLPSCTTSTALDVIRYMHNIGTKPTTKTFIQLIKMYAMVGRVHDIDTVYQVYVDQIRRHIYHHQSYQTSDLSSSSHIQDNNVLLDTEYRLLSCTTIGSSQSMLYTTPHKIGGIPYMLVCQYKMHGALICFRYTETVDIFKQSMLEYGIHINDDTDTIMLSRLNGYMIRYGCDQVDRGVGIDLGMAHDFVYGSTGSLVRMCSMCLKAIGNMNRTQLDDIVMWYRKLMVILVRVVGLPMSKLSDDLYRTAVGVLVHKGMSFEDAYRLVNDGKVWGQLIEQKLLQMVSNPHHRTNRQEKEPNLHESQQSS